MEKLRISQNDKNIHDVSTNKLEEKFIQKSFRLLLKVFKCFFQILMQKEY